MKIQNNVFGKSQDYYTMMSRQEKHQRAASYLKEVLNKEHPHYSNYGLLTNVQYVLTLLQTILSTILVTWSRHRLF